MIDAGSSTDTGGTSEAGEAGHWSALGLGMDGQVDALAFDSSGNLYAGGAFATAGGTSVNCVAKWDGSSWSALGSGVDF